MAVRRERLRFAGRLAPVWRRRMDGPRHARAVTAPLVTNRRRARTASSKPRQSSIPDSTYRIQFHKDFTFQDAIELVDYLHDLGISHCYASPIFTARHGSNHGYDVCSFERVNPALGGSKQLTKLTRKLEQSGMSLLLDIVPNHMAADAANLWWQDVLEKGPASRYARWFDIDWDSPEPGLRGRVLLPILEDDQDRVIRAGKIHLALQDKRFSIKYYDRTVPVSPASARMLKRKLVELGTTALHSTTTVRIPAHCGSCSKNKTSGWPSGALPRKSSIIAAFST